MADHAKAMDARRGATKNSRKFTTVLDRWQNDEIYRASQLVHGWTEEYVKYLDYISKIDIIYDAPYNQRNRSANALVSTQREQGKGVLHIPMNLRTRQRDTLDPAVQQHLEWLSLNWKTYYSSSSFSTWTESPTWRRSSSWDHRWKEWHFHAWQDKEWRDQ